MLKSKKINVLTPCLLVSSTDNFAKSLDSDLDQAVQNVGPGLDQGCKIIFLLTRHAGLVGGKSYSPL